MKMKIIKQLNEIPEGAKIVGKVDCMCNQCQGVIFHYLYELKSQSFIKCILHDNEVWEVEFIHSNIA